MAEQIDYSVGFHERWESWLHSRRAANRESERVETPQQEQRALEIWLTVNRRRASDAVRCETCESEIANALIEGKDPFATPDFAREAIRKFGISPSKRKNNV